MNIYRDNKHASLMSGALEVVIGVVASVCVFLVLVLLGVF
jgi:hypothetical protein